MQDRPAHRQVLVVAMKMALAAGDPAAAELVACECVVLAETKDHADWELIGECAKELTGELRQPLSDAYGRSRTRKTSTSITRKGWCRELWLQVARPQSGAAAAGRGRSVKTAIDAARVKQQRREAAASEVEA